MANTTVLILTENLNCILKRLLKELEPGNDAHSCMIDIVNHVLTITQQLEQEAQKNVQEEATHTFQANNQCNYYTSQKDLITDVKVHYCNHPDNPNKEVNNCSHNNCPLYK